MKPWLKWTLALAVVILATAITVAVYLKRQPPHIPTSTTPADIAAFVASADFNRLTLKQRADYLAKLPRGAGLRDYLAPLNEGQRRQAFENLRSVREAERNKQIKGYFALPQDQRAAWMNNYVAENQMPAFGPRDRPGQPAATAGQNSPAAAARPAPDPNRRLERIETTSPEMRAMQVQFRIEEMAARQAAGQPVRPRGNH